MDSNPFSIREELKLILPDFLCDYVIGRCWDEIGWPLFILKWGMISVCIIPVIDNIGLIPENPDVWVYQGILAVALSWIALNR